MAKPKTQFPSLKAKQLLQILERQPLGYTVARQKGSHRRMTAPGRPSFSFAFHDKATVSGSLVKEILTKDIGLSEDEARRLL